MVNPCVRAVKNVKIAESMLENAGLGLFAYDATKEQNTVIFKICNIAVKRST